MRTCSLYLHLHADMLMAATSVTLALGCLADAAMWNGSGAPLQRSSTTQYLFKGQGTFLSLTREVIPPYPGEGNCVSMPKTFEAAPPLVATAIMR